eukprot:scaffold74599_cov68-Phaeocystis_antarctica.AAC.1
MHLSSALRPARTAVRCGLRELPLLRKCTLCSVCEARACGDVERVLRCGGRAAAPRCSRSAKPHCDTPSRRPSPPRRAARIEERASPTQAARPAASQAAPGPPPQPRRAAIT